MSVVAFRSFDEIGVQFERHTHKFSLLCLCMIYPASSVKCVFSCTEGPPAKRRRSHRSGSGSGGDHTETVPNGHLSDEAAMDTSGEQESGENPDTRG